MKTVGEALWALLEATRGALEWHLESDEVALSVPDGFGVPPLGRIPLATAPPQPARRPPAPSSAPTPPQHHPEQRLSPPRTAPPSARPVAPPPTPSKPRTMPPFRASPPTAEPTIAAPRGPASITGLSPAASAAAQLQILRDEMGDCRACPLHERRNELVFGAGHPDARLMFVAGAPERQEDYLGHPFLEHGALLTDMIRGGLKLRREEVYLTYLLKCTLGGRGLPLESPEACRGHLARQIEIVKPEVIVLFDELSAQILLQTEQRLPRLRGRFHEIQGIPTRVTLPPYALVQNPQLKREVWADLQSVIRQLSKLTGAPP